MNADLERFLKAQENSYDRAFLELKQGRKRTDWIWYIFPQIDGLGISVESKRYSLKNIEEARSYLEHPILGSRLKLIANQLLLLDENNINRIFAHPDNLKIKSCMTLFIYVDDSDESVFLKVLEKYYDGMVDVETLKRIL